MTVTPSDATASVPPADANPAGGRPRGATDAPERTAPGAGSRPHDEHGDDVPHAADGALRAIVAVTVVAGVVLRFVTRSPLWLDEALSVNIAALPLGEIPEALRHDGHPPLYYALLHGWIRAFGEGDLAVRSLSGVISVATLPLAWLAGRRIGGRPLGWLALGVFALSPFAIRYATETRMYALVSLLVLAAYLLLDDVVRRDRGGLGRSAALAVVTGALLYAHYWALWLVGATGIVLLVHAWRRTGERRRAFVGAALALVAGGVLFTPWLPVMLFQSANTGTPWAPPVRPTSMLGITITDFGGGGTGAQFSDAQFVGVVMAVCALLAVFGRVVDQRRIEIDLRTAPRFRAEAAVVALTLLIAVVAGYATQSTFASRYASTLLPLILLMVAGALALFTDPRVRVGALVVVMGLFSLGCVYNLRTERTQARVAATAVAERSQAGDVILYCPDQLAPAALRVMPAEVESLAFPHLPGDPWPVDRVDWVDYAERNRPEIAESYGQEVARHAAGRSLFVVWSGSYKTHENTCEAMLHGIAAERGNGELLLGEEGGTYFEHEGVMLFPRPGG